MGNGSFKIIGTDLPMMDTAYPSAKAVTEMLRASGTPKPEIAAFNKNYYTMLEISLKRTTHGKATLTREESDEIRKINNDTVQLLKERKINVTGLGGNCCNRLHYTEAILGGLSDCSILGGVGNDPAGQYVREQLKEKNIKLTDFGETLPYTKEGIALVPPGAKDRISRSLYFEWPKGFNYKNLLDAHSKADYIYVEPTITKVIPPKDAIKLVKELKYGAGKTIFFMVPTKDEFYNDNKGMPLFQNIRAYYRIGEMANIMFSNEAEIIAYVNRKGFKAADSLDDPDLINAGRHMFGEIMSDAKNNLKDRKLNVITLGALGSIGMSYNIISHAEAVKNIEPVNTLGAGDSFSAYVASRYIMAGQKPLNPDQIARSLWGGNILASLVIQHPEAQISAELVRSYIKAFEALPLEGKNMVLHENGVWAQNYIWEKFGENIQPASKLSKQLNEEITALKKGNAQLVNGHSQ